MSWLCGPYLTVNHIVYLMYIYIYIYIYHLNLEKVVVCRSPKVNTPEDQQSIFKLT